mmetsp:Transcript_7845/g.22343  ORF Transcript_7845/g.22343 Transcript_7845/m.22343 type:complete len:208 (-) Transcript_7845:8508-9131(-)
MEAKPDMEDGGMVKCRGSLAPSGQLSSLLRGWSTRSTSSSSMTPLLNRDRISAQMPTWASSVVTCSGVRVTALVVGGRMPKMREKKPCCSTSSYMLALAELVARMWDSSAAFSTRLFTLVGLDTTTAPASRAAFSLSDSSLVMGISRSNSSVYMGLVNTEEKRCLITPRENSSRAAGTTWVMQVLPSPRSSDSNGVTTVVLPAPMMS